MDNPTAKTEPLGSTLVPPSKRVSDIPEALSIYVNQLVYDMRRRGRDVVTLSLGEAFFKIPLFDFNKLDIAKCYHYSDSQGIPELREKIAEYYSKQYGALVDPNEILISAGSKPIIFMAISALCNEGDEILIHEPAWLSYQEQARLASAVPKFIPYDAPISAFSTYFTDKTKLLVINNPNNPSGRLYTKEELSLIADQAQENGVFVLVDEAYSDFVIDEPFVSYAEVVPSKTNSLVVNSLSKNMGMSGWRVGYVISEPRLIDALLKVNQHLITCAPTILLHYMATYFDELLRLTLPQVREVVEKRNRVRDMIDEIGLDRLGGNATFYFFISVDGFEGDVMDFALYLLLEHGISVVPGVAYGDSTARFVRVSIGTESEDRIEYALRLIKDLIPSKDITPEIVDERLTAIGFHRFGAGAHANQ